MSARKTLPAPAGGLLAALSALPATERECLAALVAEHGAEIVGGVLLPEGSDENELGCPPA
jgi:hypothetical protein